jgi:hypothetical protein
MDNVGISNYIIRDNYQLNFQWYAVNAVCIFFKGTDYYFDEDGIWLSPNPADLLKGKKADSVDTIIIKPTNRDWQDLYYLQIDILEDKSYEAPMGLYGSDGLEVLVVSADGKSKLWHVKKQADGYHTIDLDQMFRGKRETGSRLPVKVSRIELRASWHDAFLIKCVQLWRVD